MGESYEGFGSRQEEVANAVTHAIGLVASALTLTVLVALAARGGDVWEIVSVSIFGTTLVLLYLASTLYHSARSERARRRLKVLDHSAIYLLIAGTYTPFTLGVIRGGWGWALFGVMWGLAIMGVMFKLFFIGRFRLISTLIYLAMGWLGAVAAGPFLQQLSPMALVWLVLGGLAYTLGTPFYQMEQFRYSHAVWHGFVMAGSACHVAAVMVQF
ncbi:MAG: hemolysin III family protein [Gemmatimonadota bacterium]